MINGFDDMQKLGKDNMDYAMKSFGSFSKGMQSLDKAMEIQTDYVKSAYEGFVAQATKVGELYADLAKDAYKPFEGMVAKATK